MNCRGRAWCSPPSSSTSDVVKGIKYDNINLGAPTGVLPDGRYSYARNPNDAPGSSNTTRWNANPSFAAERSC
jgi:hypothetical protein